MSVTRETIIEFSQPVAARGNMTDAVFAQFAGRVLDARVHLSPSRRTVTLFYAEPLPASARVRVTVDGDLLLDDLGQPMDADGDGQPGGVAIIDFDTLSLTRIPGTEVWGYVYDSYSKNPDGSDQPVVGATIRIDAFPEANAVTDEKGYFILRDMPAPAFFVHIDGSTATNAPSGAVYVTVGKSFHSLAGESTQLVMDGKPFNIYLPPMSRGDVQALSPTAATEVGFGEAGKAELMKMFPGVDAAAWAQTRVTFPANSAVDDAGNPATEATIIPVPSDRLPAPLPRGVNHQLDIAVLAMGATNFEDPAPACFPNLPDPDTGQALPAGAKSALWSFNHDTGRWEIGGPMTVSADGRMVCTDPGVGIRAPGWHGSDPASTVEGGEILKESDEITEDASVDLISICLSPCRLINDIDEPIIALKGSTFKLVASGKPGRGTFSWKSDKKSVVRGDLSNTDSSTFTAKSVGTSNIFVRFTSRSGVRSNRVRIKVHVIDIKMRALEITDQKNFKDNPTDTKLLIGEPSPGIATLWIQLETKSPDDFPDKAKELRWSLIAPSTGRRIAGTFEKRVGHLGTFGNQIAVFGGKNAISIPLEGFLKQGIRDVQITVGFGQGEQIDQVTNLMDVRIARVELDVDEERPVTKFGGTPEVIVNDDFDEGKKDSSGKLVSDNKDASPVKADGSAYASGDLLFLDIKVPDDATFRTGSKITINQIGGNGKVRLLVLSGRREFTFGEINLGANILDDFFTPGGIYYSWFPAIEGITPGEVTLELKLEKDGTTLTDTLTLRVFKVTHFIAIADRPVDFTRGNVFHYSLEYWECGGDFTPLRTRKGFTRPQIVANCRALGGTSPKMLGEVELLASMGWDVWAGIDDLLSPGRSWTEPDVWVSAIMYTGTKATKIMPIYTGDAAHVQEKWAIIIGLAENYKWGEQPDFAKDPTAPVFTQWPRSMYKSLQTNSNTFVRYLVNGSGLTMTDMSRFHPGAQVPSQNTELFNPLDTSSRLLTFYKEQTPWKGSGPKKPSAPPP